MHLTHPEHRLLADRPARIVVQHVEQHRLGIRRLLLRQQEHRLLAQRDGALVPLLQYLPDDWQGALRVHLEQRVHRGRADLAVIAVAVTRLIPRGRPGHSLRGPHVALLGEDAADPNGELLRVGDRRRLREPPLLRIERPERLPQVVVATKSIESEGAPVRSVRCVLRPWILRADLGEQHGGATELATIDRFATQTVE
jgi:hypothetical protein